MADRFTRRAFVALAGGAAGPGAGSVASLPDAAGSVAATPAPAWEATYGRGGVTWTGDVVAAADGGYLLACSSAREPGAPDDAWLVKVDGDGNREWDRSYGGEDADKARSVVRGSDGGYAFLGVTYSKGDGDAWLVRVDDEGAVAWERTFADRYPRDLLATADGDFLVAGRTGDGEDPFSDAWLALLDSDGEARWQSTYPGGGDDTDGEPREHEATALAETEDGFVFAGSTEREGDWQGWLATVDETGQVTDERLFTEAPHLRDVVPTDDGYVVTGVHQSSTATYNVGWLARLGHEGSTAWSRTWERVTPSAVAATDDGYLVAGDRNIPWPLGYFEAWAGAVTPAGEERWTERYRRNGGEGFDQALATTDGGPLLLGHTGPAFPDEEEFREKEAWLLKLADGRAERGWLPDVLGVGRTGAVGTLALAAGAVVAGAVAVRRRRDGEE